MKVSPRIELLCIGTELLRGQLNTHQSYLSLGLESIGLNLAKESSLPDDMDLMRHEIKKSLQRCDVLLLCGGLGPTFDDITREAAAWALGRPLKYHPRIFGAIVKKFKRYRLPIPEENKRQAFVIKGARVLKNKMGSAPGQMIVLPRDGALPQTTVMLPGPSGELKPMFESAVLPHLKKTYAKNIHAQHFCFHLSGISESASDEKLKKISSLADPALSFTILASQAQVDFHVSIMTASRERMQLLAQDLRRRIYKAVGDSIFGEGIETLESVVGKRLRDKNLTLSVAESCTGGMLGQKLTAVPGSSDYFLGGAIVYSNELKIKLLGVKPQTLKAYGAVSAECAREMSIGTRKLTGSNLGISITGIAGPQGGNKPKPVGLIFVSLSGPREEVHELRFSGNREAIRQKAANMALHLLLRHLKKD